MRLTSGLCNPEIYSDYIIHRLISNAKKSYGFYKSQEHFRIQKQLPDYVWRWHKRGENGIFTFSMGVAEEGMEV